MFAETAPGRRSPFTSVAQPCLRKQAWTGQPSAVSRLKLTRPERGRYSSTVCRYLSEGRHTHTLTEQVCPAFQSALGRTVCCFGSVEISPSPSPSLLLCCDLELNGDRD
ncbi:hypothetical protein BaRGS_00015854 [Batillaria attramentaria]|uniref:Uncharacterized protein n=1 Tax=Batillaria attramentaria TaxID=370345 RepID=A0ABD0L0H1_9CAEN